MEPLFSERHDLWKPTEGLVRERIQDEVRNAARNSFRTLAGEAKTRYGTTRWTSLWQFIVQMLDLDPTLIDSDQRWYDNRDGCDRFLRDCAWNHFLDACVLIHRWCIVEKEPESAEGFANRLNRAFLRYYSAYRMEADGQIVEPGSDVGERAVAEARALLRDSGMNGPDRVFQSGLDAFHRRPDPDYEHRTRGRDEGDREAEKTAQGSGALHRKSLGVRIR